MSRIQEKKAYRPAHIYKLISSIKSLRKRNLLRGYSAKPFLRSSDVEEIRKQNSLHDSVISGAILKGPKGLWDGEDQCRKKTSLDLSRMTSFPAVAWRNEVCHTAGYINAFIASALEVLDVMERLAHLEIVDCDDALELLLKASEKYGSSNYLSYKLAYLRTARQLNVHQLAKVNEIEEQFEHRTNAGLHFSALENLSSRISLFVVARRRVGALAGKVDGKIRTTVSLSNFVPTPLDEEDVGEFLLRATESCLIDSIYAVVVLFNLHEQFPTVVKELENRLEKLFVEKLRRVIFGAKKPIPENIVTDQFRKQNADSEPTLDLYRTSAAFLECQSLATYRNKLDRVIGTRLLAEILGEKVYGLSEPLHSKELLLAADGTLIPGDLNVKLDSFFRTYLFLCFLRHRANILTLNKGDVQFIFENTLGLEAVLTESEMRALYLTVPPESKSLVAVLALALFRKKSIDPDVDFEFRTDFISHVNREHGGSIVDFIDSLLTDSPMVANYITGALDESTLEKMYSLIDNASQASTIRCDMLRAVGKKLNRIEYFIEADAITTRAKVATLQQYFDNSRMYVDSIAMKKWLDINPTMSTEQYRALYSRLEVKESTDDGRGSNRNDIVVAEIDDQDDYLLSEVAKDAFEQFCLNTEFGIESYLGRRIRHNTLDGVTTEIVDVVLNKPEYSVLLANPAMRRSVESWKILYGSIINKLRNEHLQFKSPNSLFKHTLDLEDITTKANIRQLSSTLQSAGGAELLNDLVIAFCWRQITPQLQSAAFFIKNDLLREANASINKSFVHCGIEDGRMKAALHEAVNEVFRKVADWFQVPRTGFVSASIRDLCEIVAMDVGRQGRIEFSGEWVDAKYTGISVHRLYDCLAVLLQNASKYGRPDSPITVGVKTSRNVEGTPLDFLTISVKSLALPQEYQNFKSRINEAIKTIATGVDMVTESPRILRRLKSLRGLSHEEVKQVFTRGPRTRCSHGAGASGRVPIAMGGHRIYRAQDRLRAADPQRMGQAR